MVCGAKIFVLNLDERYIFGFERYRLAHDRYKNCYDRYIILCGESLQFFVGVCALNFVNYFLFS